MTENGNFTKPPRATRKWEILKADIFTLFVRVAGKDNFTAVWRNSPYPNITVVCQIFLKRRSFTGCYTI